MKIESSFDIYVSATELDPEDKKLLDKALYAMYKAYAPYSHFYVGAAALLENGVIITGNNQENAAYPSGLCAERVAVFHASSQYPGVKILAIAVCARSEQRKLKSPVSPCGACRQSLLEYEIRFERPIRLIMGGESGQVIISPSVNNMLPLAFNSNSL